MAIDFFDTFEFTNDEEFPDTQAVNSSGATATDGTEITASLVNTLWGMVQAEMDRAGLTPNLTREQPGDSQVLEAHEINHGGPGEGVIWLGEDDPATVGRRVLLEQGQGVERSSYPDLDDAVYVGDDDNDTADAYYHADNSDGSSRNENGDYLILPDRRGLALRWSGTNGELETAGGDAYEGPERWGSQLDQGQLIEGEVGRFRAANSAPQLTNAEGVFSAQVTGQAEDIQTADGTSDDTERLFFDSDNSPDARTSSTTGGETRGASTGGRAGVRY